MDRNGNENCLEGYECPKCGEHDKLYIVGVTTFEVHDDGTEEHNDIEWDGGSSVTCGNSECGHDGKLRGFEIA